jgi:hypothetical protein
VRILPNASKLAGFGSERTAQNAMRIDQLGYALAQVLSIGEIDQGLIVRLCLANGRWWQPAFEPDEIDTIVNHRSQRGRYSLMVAVMPRLPRSRAKGSRARQAG